MTARNSACIYVYMRAAFYKTRELGHLVVVCIYIYRRGLNN